MVGQSEGQLFCGVSITTHRYTQVIAMLLRLHKAIIPVHSDPRDLPVTFRSELYLPVVRQQDAEDNQQNPQARRDRHAADQNNSVTKSIEHNANHRNYEDFRRRPRKGGGNRRPPSYLHQIPTTPDRALPRMAIKREAYRRLYDLRRLHAGQSQRYQQHPEGFTTRNTLMLLEGKKPLVHHTFSGSTLATLCPRTVPEPAGLARCRRAVGGFPRSQPATGWCSACR